MLEIKINILKGVNKRLRVSNFIRSMHWDMWKVPNAVQLLIAGKTFLTVLM